MRLSIVDKDKGFGALIGSVEELKRKDDHVVVGLPYGRDTEDEEDGVKLIDYAVWNEFGTDRIPSRPFIRQPFDNSREKLIKAAEQLLGKVIDGTIDKHSALEVLGDTFLAEIRLSIDRREYEPNAPSTIRAKKGKDKPLVNSGRLQQSLKYEVR